MCGICGFAGSGDKEDLRRMLSLLVHRGPDAEGLWYSEESAVYLGHRRLSIIDIAGGSQPMWTSDGSLGIVFNGEIYNFKELRDELEKKGHKFRSSHSDTEVLLYGYREWREDLPSKLNGMWAFVIYDIPRKCLFASRDRFGKKPFFYTFQNDTFIFASELTSLIKHKGTHTAVSKDSLKKYFAYGYIPAPRTIYESIFKLPGGYSLTFDLNSRTIQTEKHWDFVLEPDNSLSNESFLCEKIRELLDNAVRRRLISDVPLGIFLSGGIDSSSVTRFASNHIPAAELQTFSIGFDEPSFDETVYSSMIARHIGTNHHHHVLSYSSARTMLDDVLSRLDEPMGDSSLIPTFLLCRETRKNVTVALGGDGADELFAGYDPFRALQTAGLYNRIVPKPVHTAVRLIMSRLPVSLANMSLDFKIKRTLRGLSYPQKLWNSIWLGPLAPHEIAELFNDKEDLESLYSEAITAWDECAQENIVDRTLQFYTKLYLQDDILVKIDRASMMNSLEVRAPFLDIELVDFVRRIPHCFKFRKGQTKYILKKAMEPLLPGEILYRKKKGFGVPVGKWFTMGMLDVQPGSLQNHIKWATAARYRDEHLKRKCDNRSVLWNIYVMNRYLAGNSIV